MKKQYRKIKFAIEDLRVFDGFMPLDLANEPFNGYWNGWLCPYVDEATHKELVQWMIDGVKGREEEEADFLEDLKHYADQEPNQDGLYYWGGCWIWDEVKDVPRCSKCGYEWSACIGDDELPDACECGGKILMEANQ